MKLVAYSLSYVSKGKIKKAKPKETYFEPSYWDLTWDTDLALFDLSHPASRRAAEAFERTVYEDIHRGETAKLLKGLKKLRGPERARRILDLEGRAVALHKQDVTIGKRVTTVHSYLRPAKKGASARARAKKSA